MVRMMLLGLSLAGIAAGAAAQSLPPPPLDLKLAPASSVAPPSQPPAGSAHSGAAPASSALPDSPPGVYYGDTSGRIYASAPRAPAIKCDDATYGQAQTHGSVGMGVMGGNHVSGNYETATVNVTKRLGSCEDPKGNVGFTINVGQGNFRGRGRGW